MKILRYSFRTALKSIWLEKWINMLAVLSVSIGLFVLCAFAALTINLDSVIQKWSRSFGIIVYLNDDISREREEGLKNQLMKDSDVLDVSYISKDQALEDVKDTLGANSMILSSFKDDLLPASFELKLRTDVLDPALVKQKAAQIEKMRGVNEVQYGEQWLSSLSTVSRIMKTGMIIAGFGIFLAVTFITYSTIKMFFYRRKEEIETLKLLGAAKGFIKLPFLLEGLFVGILGGAISAIVLYSVQSVTTLSITEFFPLIGLNIKPLPLLTFAAIPFAGAFMSLIGSIVAVGKIRY